MQNRNMFSMSKWSPKNCDSCLSRTCQTMNFSHQNGCFADSLQRKFFTAYQLTNQHLKQTFLGGCIVTMSGIIVVFEYIENCQNCEKAAHKRPNQHIATVVYSPALKNVFEKLF